MYSKDTILITADAKEKEEKKNIVSFLKVWGDKMKL